MVHRNCSAIMFTSSAGVSLYLLASCMSGLNPTRSWAQCRTSRQRAYTKINSSPVAAGSRSFEDIAPLPANYYYIKVSDVNGHTYQTFPALGQPQDNTPPATPQLLTGKCNSNGLVTINWNRNTDPDIMGYRVFMSTALNGDYLQITSTWINDTVYRHQVNVNTLSEEMYFAIKAVDFRENTSPLSAPISVMRTDVVPPSAPVIKSATADFNGVFFEWTLSSSADVVLYQLERRTLGFTTWDVILSFETKGLLYSYTDTTASPRKKYEYRLTAVDDANLKSSSQVVRIKPVDKGLRQGFKLNGTLSNTPRSHTLLQWQYPDDPDLIGFEIYRAVLDSTRQRSFAFLQIPPPKLSAADTLLQPYTTLNGNTWSCVFRDFEHNFNQKNLNIFYTQSNPQGQPNTSVPAPGGGNNYTVPAPNNTNGQPSTTKIKLYYWVIAKFADGAYSPMSEMVVIEL